ncbi:MAG: SEC-C metal-binding domain-containing protein, partial [Gammaproteobacteria bacterium]
MTKNNFSANDDGDNELNVLFSVSARILLKSDDLPAYLDWIAESGPMLAPTLAKSINPDTGPVGNAFRALGISIYEAMPLPAHNYRVRAVPRPGRNAPCLCGSSRKYKHCCLTLEGVLSFREYNMLRHVLDYLPKKEFSSLPDTAVAPVAIADTAHQWRNENELLRAVALLEPWFAGSGKLNGKLAPLFDELMDLYYLLGNTRKRSRLTETLKQRGDRELRATALQRQATILADRGQFDEAWQAFTDAQREYPDDPALSMLETTLLLSRGEYDRARERARFWIARIARLGDPDFAELLRVLHEVAADPQQALADIGREMHPGLDSLARLFAAAPPAAACYQIAPADMDGVLLPDKTIAGIEARWRELFPQVKPMLTMTQHDDTRMWDQPEDWLRLLEKSPRAWQSLDIIDDLAMAVDALQLMGVDTTLLEPLLDRGTALLQANLEMAATVTLPWGFMENRPALRLLAHRLFRTLHYTDSNSTLLSDVVKQAETLLTLNPNDNHGIRDLLMRGYLEADELDKALALA